MFHTPVLNARAKPQSLERTIYLMDKSIWRGVLRDYMRTGQADAQWAFEEYSMRHVAKYGEDFPPWVTTESF